MGHMEFVQTSSAFIASGYQFLERESWLITATVVSGITVPWSEALDQSKVHDWGNLDLGKRATMIFEGAENHLMIMMFQIRCCSAVLHQIADWPATSKGSQFQEAWNSWFNGVFDSQTSLSTSTTVRKDRSNTVKRKNPRLFQILYNHF
jgi:hypothetical protein